MPPDSCQHDRLQKVLNGLEAEAIRKKESVAILDSSEPEVQVAKATRTDNDFIKFNNYQYVDNGAFGLLWSRILFFGALQAMHLYALTNLVLYGSPTNVKTAIFGWALFVYSALSVTAGSHRLWSHKSYQARWPLRLFLMIGHCLAGQSTVYNWCRDHRVHHKYSETDADPHNSRRGFFFAHVGWLLTKSHPDFVAQTKVIYADDLLKDPMVYFQHHNYGQICFVFGLIVPMFVPAFLWGESLWTSFLLAVVVRYVTSLHNTWFVNSAAHMFGERPYNEKIEPRQNPAVSFGALGEGYHNYHHSYPWDYATSESGVGSLNFTKFFIDTCSKVGLAYDCKKANSRKKQ
ncbi:Stearoyl-CoA desaturase 5 [Halotydeus destructor]|nr:Stearoyl-CoA desaturase 5 [Halotydeus destructor]